MLNLPARGEGQACRCGALASQCRGLCAKCAARTRWLRRKARRNRATQQLRVGQP
jgi:hypothetical protein